MKQSFTNLKMIICSAASLLCIGNTATAQNTWASKAGAPSGANIRTCFSIGSKGYGIDTSNFYEYDPSSNAWTAKANFPGGYRDAPAIFILGTKAYVGLGQDRNDVPQTQMWEYDQGSNTWTAKASFPGAARFVTFSFDANGKGYVCGGYDGTNAYKDVWEYNSSSNTWTQKSDMALGKRAGGSGFTIANKGYIVCGASDAVDDSLKKECWQYDASADTWARKTDFPGGARVNSVSYAINGHGFVMAGSPHVMGDTIGYNDLWEYDPAANTWAARANYPGMGVKHTTGCAIGTKGYLGFGNNSTGSSVFDFWQYTPYPVSVAQQHKNGEYNLYPNPNKGQFVFSYQPATGMTFNIVDLTGRVVLSTPLSATSTQTTIDASYLKPGMYGYTVGINGDISHSGTFVLQ